MAEHWAGVTQSDDELIRLVDPRTGHFALESGDHGDLWLDLDRLFMAPDEVAPFASRLAERLSPVAFDVVCGPSTGGALLAGMIAAELDLPFCATERVVSPDVAGGNMRGLVTYRLPERAEDAVAGRSIAVVDDAINAGHAVGGTVSALRTAGAEPVIVGALLVLESSGAPPAMFDGLPLTTLARLASGRWRADACPLCAQGVPLIQKG